MRVAVLGAGAWGTALAAVLATRHDASLWARDEAQASSLRAARRNQRYLPEIVLPEPLAVTSDLVAAVRGAALVLVATPVAALRDALARLAALGAGAPVLSAGAAVIWGCKGFEPGSGLLPHQVAAQVLPPGTACGVLSGPSFALEVARGLPCALTLASRDAEVAKSAAALLHGGRVRVYYSTDLDGVEIAGAVKNVMAIAVGICDGLGLGQNARAALITRGLAEMQRLGVALGGAADTFMGLAGAGDLILTATGDLSRNRRVGLELARGRRLADVLASLGHVAEGVLTAKEVVRLARGLGLELPVSEAVDAVLEGRLAPPAAVERLLARDAKAEAGGA